MKIALVFHGTRETRDAVDLDTHRLGPTAAASAGTFHLDATILVTRGDVVHSTSTIIVR